MPQTSSLSVLNKEMQALDAEKNSNSNRDVRSNSENEKDFVYVFLRTESAEQGKGFRFSLEKSIREIIESVVESEGLDKSLTYLLSIPELSLYIPPDERQLPVRRYKFVQACKAVGVFPIFEIFGCPPGVTMPSRDMNEVAQLIMKHASILCDIGQSYLFTLGSFNEEVIMARKSFTLLAQRVLKESGEENDGGEDEKEGNACERSEGSEHKAKEVEGGEESAPKFPLRREAVEAYVGAEPPLPQQLEQRGRASVQICGYLINHDEPITFTQPLDTPVAAVVRILYNFAPPGTGEPPEVFALKVVGRREFLVPERVNGCCGDVVPFLLGDYDYVRQCVRREENVVVQIVHRSEALPEPLSPAAASSHAAIVSLLTRNVWRQADHAAVSPVPLSTLGNFFAVEIRGCYRLPSWRVTGGNGSSGSSSSSSNNSTSTSGSISGNGSGSNGSGGTDGSSTSGSLDTTNEEGEAATVQQQQQQQQQQPPQRRQCAYVAVGIYHGGKACAPLAFTPVRECSGGFVTWNQSLEIQLPYKRIPREGRLCFTVYGAEAGALGTTPREVSDRHVPLGWGGLLIMDYRGFLRTGNHCMHLWEGRANPIGPCTENAAAALESPVLTVRLPARCASPVAFVDEEGSVKSSLPVSVPVPVPASQQPQSSLSTSPGSLEDNNCGSTNNANVSSSSTTTGPRLKAEHTALYKATLAADPLTPLSEEQRMLLWEYRDLVRKSKPRQLAKVLRSVNWAIPYMVQMAHRLLATWDLLPPTVALELLDAQFADTHVRDFAVRCLEQMSDAEVSEFLIQLIQVLRYEPYHDSSLARFLLTRALKSQNRIGHMFFWYLNADMAVPEVSERYGILLEMYLTNCGPRRYELEDQLNLLSRLEAVARTVKQTPTKEARMKVIADGLAKIPFPRPLPLPLDPRLVVDGLYPEKCKFFDSKKVPLLLVFRNADPRGKPIHVIFKVGDDLRQDILTLQVMRVMDTLWKKQGTDYGMQLYKCVATGDSVGMIEVVLNAETTTSIAKSLGGVLSDNTITDWLKKNISGRKNTQKHKHTQTQTFNTHLNSFISFITFIIFIIIIIII